MVGENGRNTSVNSGHLSKKHRSSLRSPYKCSFCDEHLKVVADEGMARLSVLYFVRTFQCPHCFTRFRRPLEFLGRIPFVSRMFGFRFAGSDTETLVEKHQADRSNGARSPLSRLGRTVQRMEKRFIDATLAILLFPIRLIRSLFTRKNKSSRSSRGSSRSRFDNSLRNSYSRQNRWTRFLKWLAGSDRR